MLRSDANNLSLKIIRKILDAARELEVDIAGTKVRLTPTRQAQPDWPDVDLPQLSEADDGPWPRPVEFACEWDGGKTVIKAYAGFNRKATANYSHACKLVVALSDHHRRLVSTVVAAQIDDTADGSSAPVCANVSLMKRSETSDTMPGWAESLKETVAASGIPMQSTSKAELFRVELPDGELLPSPETALRRLLRVALLKLDHLDPGRTAARGTPLVETPPLLDSAEIEDQDDDAEDTDAPRQRQYWAGGFLWDTESQLETFVAGDFWQLGWPRDSKRGTAKTAWHRFGSIRPGDHFAIKGYGGSHDLVVHYVGRVVSIDAESGRLELSKLDIAPYRGKAPRGPGSGNWRDALLPVGDNGAIRSIFGVTDEVRSGVGYPSSNLILFGPPGTGKTYRIQNSLQPLFTRRRSRAAATKESQDEFLRRITWYEAIALAIVQSGGEASVAHLNDHPLLTTKHRLADIKVTLRARLWNTLQNHAVEESQTVNVSRRTGELVFDKRPDGTWFFPKGPPASADAILEEFQSVTAPVEKIPDAEDFTFVTFHQSYSYEDFVEGIRPRIAPSGESPDADLGGGIGYVLEDGVFKRAVRAALRLAGFDDSIDACCRLPREQRRELFDGKPHYAVFVDEINRGNVANIFGELITLLEEDKRLGEENEVIVTLPYSKTKFGVPPNLHIIGTMNTADRSVEALDAALRRRFTFEECMPDYGPLDFEITGGIDPARLLKAINERLVKLYDRDHTIGHAYLLRLQNDPSLEALKAVFARQIIPLLQEYFFNDWGQMSLVLGRDFVRRVDSHIEFARGEHDDVASLSERPVYELTNIDALSSVSFRRIYEDVSEDD